MESTRNHPTAKALREARQDRERAEMVRRISEALTASRVVRRPIIETCSWCGLQLSGETTFLAGKEVHCSCAKGFDAWTNEGASIMTSLRTHNPILSAEIGISVRARRSSLLIH